MFVTSYCNNAKKFLVTTQPKQTKDKDGNVEECIELGIETFDRVSFVLSRNQIAEIARVTALCAAGTHTAPVPRVPRRAPAPQAGYAPPVDRPDDDF